MVTDQQPFGLTTLVVAERRQQYGPNSIVTKQALRPFVEFLRSFNSPLLWVIIVASTISFFVGERTNAVILVVMVSFSAILDYTNTARSTKAVNTLIAKVVTTATVQRDGKFQDVPLEEIVPGDVVQLSSGDVIPADGLIRQGRDIYVNESALTGESLPAAKTASTNAASQSLDRNNPAAVFMGTSVVTGTGLMEVTTTGRSTAYGKIAERLAKSEPTTDFDRGIRSFSTFLLRVTVIMVTLVFLFNAAAHRGILESLIFAIAIAIGLTPELLPVILTVSLSRGAVRMSKQSVIVKRLPAIQNIGRMNILCTDKTGTLTENKISVVKYTDCFGVEDEQVLSAAGLSSVFHSGVSNPLDDAIRNYRQWSTATAVKIDEIPFDFERRRESVVVEREGQRWLITKGAPEAVVPICQRYASRDQVVQLDASARQTAEQVYTSFSQDGYRVLAVAQRIIQSRQPSFEADHEHDMILLGYIALLDPPKAGVKETIDRLEDLGIGIKILTGDNLLLTEKICRVIDVPIHGSITGQELHGLDQAQFQQAVMQNSIFARIDPEQKEQIIAALQHAGQVVGFLGDGINDAPALKAADVGISVNNAVDVAKETADIILLRHSLNAIRDGVLEGRRTFHNTMKYIKMGLSANFGNMFSMTAASAFMPFLPMLPTQLLLNNFLYDTSQLALSTDQVDQNDLTKPTAWDLRFVRRFMLVFGPISSFFDFVTFAILLWVFHLSAAGFQTGWFIESLASQVLVIYVIRTKRIPFLSSRPSAWLLVNTLVTVTIGWLLPYLPVNHFFHFTPLSFRIVLAIAGIVVFDLLITEFLKHWFYRRFDPQST